MLQNQDLVELVRKRPEEIMRIANERHLSSEELLVLKSRSFAYPIFGLEILKGEGESEKNKRPEVQTLYNILRWLDTAEDGYLGPLEKQTAIDEVVYITAEVARRGPAENIDDILNGDLLGKLSRKIRKGAVDNEERVFVEHFHHGPVLRDFARFGAKTKEAIRTAVANMATGMKYHLKEEIQTEEHLKRYCYYVAASIGETLNRFVKNKDNKNLKDEGAKALGELLQVTNIAKNIYDDYQRGVSFVPTEYHPEVDYKVLFTGNSRKAREAREEILTRLLSIGESDFPAAMDYINLIPSPLRGYRAFCMMPLIAAKETWNTMKDAGAVDVFRGEKEAIKISYDTFKNIGLFVRQLALQDEGEGLIDWGKQYGVCPQIYSFESKKHESWRGEWLSVA